MNIQYFAASSLPVLALFDILVAVVIVIGIQRGRKHGISEELLPVLQWLAILVVGAYTYRPGGTFLHDLTGLSLTTSQILVYLADAGALKLMFSWFRRLCGDKLLTADAFGKAEYPLGMMAGVVRCFSILLFGLSLIHAIYVSEAEKAAYAKMQNDNFGKSYFPSLGSIQDKIFKDSLTGRTIKLHLAELLIQPVAEVASPARDTLKKKRERAVDEVLKP